MQTLSLELEIWACIVGSDLPLKDPTLATLQKLGDISHVDNAELSLWDVNSIFGTSFLQLDEEWASDNESQKWIYDLFGFINDFDIWDFYSELTE